MSEFQPDMTLSAAANPLKEALDGGKFVFLAESSAPENESKLEAAVERLLPLSETMEKQSELVGGLAVTDRYGAPWSAAEIAAAWPEAGRNRNLYYLSGAGRSPADVAGQLGIFANAGAENIVHVSGEAGDLPLRACRMRNFCGCTAQLSAAGRLSDKFFPGAVFNPFHYDKDTVGASYAALDGKIAAGAQFIVTQSGWDMLQNQTVAWYLLKCKNFLPLIAHLTLLSPDRAERIIAGKVPGVRMTPAFGRLLERELRGSKAQFEAAQYRRIELQCAGCRLMGYSGVQIAGVDFPGKAQIIAGRIRAAFQEFRSFEHWLDEYNAHQGGAEMDGGIGSYHLFDRVLRRDYPFDDPPQITAPEAVEYPWRERVNYRLKRFFFSRADRQRPGRDLLLKKLLAGCRGCEECTLPQTGFICLRNCPKRLDAGPCGEVNENGGCPVSGTDCVFVRKLRCTAWRGQIPCLEQHR